MFRPTRSFRTAAPTLSLVAALTVSAAYAEDAVPQNDLLNATLWMQVSPEYKAVTESLYALARVRLDEALTDKSWTALTDKEPNGYQDLPVAIITDLDETVLDNNPYEASLVTRGTGFNLKEWTSYVNDEATGAVPGAVKFLQYAASKGVKVFYVTNRTAEEEPATRKNMEALGFPMGDNVDTLLTKGEKPEWKSAKENRDAEVAKGYRVVLMLGDNLGDFTDKASGSPEARDNFLRETAAHWGHDWIMLPNPEYGSWESAAFGGDWSKSADDRRKDKIGALKPWAPKG